MRITGFEKGLRQRCPHIRDSESLGSQKACGERTWSETHHHRLPGTSTVPSPEALASARRHRGVYLQAGKMGFVSFYFAVSVLQRAVRYKASGMIYMGWFRKSWVQVLPRFLLGAQGGHPVPLRLFPPFTCFLYFLNTFFHSKVPDYILGAL